MQKKLSVRQWIGVGHMAWLFFILFKAKNFFMMIPVAWVSIGLLVVIMGLWGMWLKKIFYGVRIWSILSIVVLFAGQIGMMKYTGVDAQNVWGLCLFLGYTCLLFYERSQPYYPQTFFWYASQPDCLPLTCSFQRDKKQDIVFFVPSQLNHKGLLAVLKEHQKNTLQSCKVMEKVQVFLQFRGQSLQLTARLVHFFRAGVGVQFEPLCQDDAQHLHHFLETLKAFGFKLF